MAAVCILGAGCEKKTEKFSIVSFFEDYGMTFRGTEIVISDIVKYRGKRFARGEFSMTKDQWNKFLAELKTTHRFINHFQLNDSIDARNRKILCIAADPCDVYPFQVYSTNTYFYVMGKKENILIKCLIEFK